MPRRAAFWLALALGVNWIWSRTAGEIQSEPLYLLLQASALLLADRLPGSRGGRRLGLAVALGLLAGLALLTRQVGLVLVGAVALHLAIGRAWGAAALATGLALAVNLPWIAWQAGNPQKKQVAYFSSSQRFDRKADAIVPDLVAPGVSVTSAKPGGGYQSMDGSSMATPHVAGLAALLMEARPEKTAAEVEAAIFASCRLAEGMTEDRAHRGMPDAVRALEALG